jgi:hypothetical protein
MCLQQTASQAFSAITFPPTRTRPSRLKCHNPLIKLVTQKYIYLVWTWVVGYLGRSQGTFEFHTNKEFPTLVKENVP